MTKRINALKFVDALAIALVLLVGSAMLLPAVYAARGTSRQAVCQDKLRRIGEAVQSHVNAQRHFPTGGWGSRWIGDPDRGYDDKQTGGWIYSTLAYLERDDLRQIGAGLQPAEKRVAMKRLLTTTLPEFNCPSRREQRNYPIGQIIALNSKFLVNVDSPATVAKSDYAANAGSRYVHVGGPATLAEGDSNFPWMSGNTLDGISFVKSRIAPADIRDGLAQTYLVGEKYLNQDSYKNGLDKGDDLSMYCGFDDDIYRIGEQPHLPLERAGLTLFMSFGSPHPYGVQYVFCDGSVRAVSGAIDREIHRCLCMRDDGQVVDDRLDEFSHLVDFSTR